MQRFVTYSAIFKDPPMPEVIRYEVHSKDRKEVAVIRNDNFHGYRSYGWFDKDSKICIYNVYHSIPDPDDFTWNAILETAQKVCDHMNAKLMAPGDAG